MHLNYKNLRLSQAFNNSELYKYKSYQECSSSIVIHSSKKPSLTHDTCFSAVTSLAWFHEDRYFVVGYEDGKILFSWVNNRDKTHTVDAHNGPIVDLLWDSTG